MDAKQKESQLQFLRNLAEMLHRDNREYAEDIAYAERSLMGLREKLGNIGYSIMMLDRQIAELEIEVVDDGEDSDDRMR